MLDDIGRAAREASRMLAVTRSEQRNAALKAIAEALRANKDAIIAANEIDLENGKAAGLSAGLLDRLALNESRIEGMASGCEEVAGLLDPLGVVDYKYTNPAGIDIKRVRVPLGVIGIIYEARPNVTVDAAALCLKSGNAVILRGGKEAINSNITLSDIMRKAICDVGFDCNCIQLITDTSRRCAIELMQLSNHLDVLIPRGGAGLIKSVVENSKVPIIETGTGNCHAFIDETADVQMAAEIIYNAKCSRPSVCNALETLLVHEKAAEKALPVVAEKLRQKKVKIFGCETTRSILGQEVEPATEKEYETEFLDYVLAIKVVKDINEALDHIQRYSSGHSECIITQNKENAENFLHRVDSAAVYVNASTRFTDGNEFGFGAEIGISTQKLHARGPMGISQLTSMKYIIHGDGNIR
ncbi:MAG: glutamate-5-semialdehyde dehydrogenase [bacterium]|nr:glutamate-5-semialdehyde dehydrogenase [bacterium]